MAEGMLAVAVFCMFAFGFYIADIVDQFLGKIQENVEEIQHSSKILFLNFLSDEELLREIHECKRQYKEAEIVIFDVKGGSKKEF
jgi:Mg2+ and Co2+ transporter CorA